MKPYADCMEVREDFSAYLDGELEAGARGAFEAHLAICAECLRELDGIKRVDDAYRGLTPVAAPSGFEAGVREAVRTGQVPSAAPARTASRWMGPLLAMASAAAVLAVGVLILEQRTQNRANFEMAAGPLADEMVSGAANALNAEAPPESHGVGGAAATGGAWDQFTRSAPAEPKRKAAWDEFAKAPASAPVTAETSGGREDSGDALAEGLAQESTADKKESEARARVAYEQPTDAEARDRAEVIGTPPAEADRAPAATAPEKVLDAPAVEEQVVPDSIAPRAERGPGAPGEVLSRQTLRSFRVKADGVWYQSGYDGQERTVLKRNSATLRELMKRNSEEDWSQMLDRPHTQVFELGGLWYELEAAPNPAN